MQRYKILGPPGTGKTTRLLALLEKELETVPPKRIAFVSFTRRGTYEGAQRAFCFRRCSALPLSDVALALFSPDRQ